jgi:hypothetical protein
MNNKQLAKMKMFLTNGGSCYFCILPVRNTIFFFIYILMYNFSD